VKDREEGRDVSIVAPSVFVERELLTEGNDSMQRRWSKALGHRLILGVVLCSSLSLSGCGVFDFLGDLFSSKNGNEAQAQQEGFINSFVIVPGSLEMSDINIQLEIGTQIRVQDGATIYQGFDARVSFTPTSASPGGNQNSLELEADHILIERYGSAANTLLWIR
jgi:hypothetical protein